MYTHHTKDKGDIGLGFVVADLMSKGIHVALPLSEHLPFDCIAISPIDGAMVRISVKYRHENAKGRLDVKLASVWSNAKGCHLRKYDKTEFDVIAVYCPEQRCCYYVKTKEAVGANLMLRVSEPKQRQSNKQCKRAVDFIDVQRIFVK